MIENTICPYCCRALIKAENQDNSRSVEHLIPNAALTRKRKNDEGDFYACRKCNSKKSSMDYILGIIAKAQSNDDTLAANTLINSVVKDNGATKRIIDMLNTANAAEEGTIHAEMPIDAKELIEYIHYLGKGQYFKVNGKPYNPNTQIMDPTFANKQILSWIENSYVRQCKRNPFLDLQKNSHTEIISNGECFNIFKE